MRRLWSLTRPPAGKQPYASLSTEKLIRDSVDAQTDTLVQHVLRTSFAARTIIAIAHRLDTILDFDRVVVMHAGGIAETGEPNVLLETRDSLFRGLMDSQSDE